jgi:hypothetical protein
LLVRLLGALKVDKKEEENPVFRKDICCPIKNSFGNKGNSSSAIAELYHQITLVCLNFFV